MNGRRPGAEAYIRARVVVAHDGCWNWTLALNPNGYGRASRYGIRGYAHRFAYMIMVGPIPKGMEIDHLCRNRACVNPEHLEPVTHLENTRRALVHRSEGTQQ